METKLSPMSVEVRNFEQGTVAVGEYGGGFSGQLYFNKKQIATFHTDGFEGYIDHIYVADTKSEEAMLEYQLANEQDEYYQTVEGFVSASVDFYIMKKEAVQAIKDYVTKYPVTDKKTVGAFIFKDGIENVENFLISVFNCVPSVLTEDDMEKLKETAREHGYYNDFKHVFFMKYTSERKTMLEQIK